MESHTINFTKMHGLGNDYIYIDCMSSTPEHLNDLSIEMSRRHTGVGGDGIILILPSEIADFKMRIFNADGSEAKMCGNGSRCVAKYVYDHALTHNKEITLETNSGVKHLRLYVNDETDKVEMVSVNMGKPSVDCRQIGMTIEDSTYIDREIRVADSTFVMSAVSMGNPHGVIWTDNVCGMDVATFGRQLEMSEIWTDRANIEFVRIDSPHQITMRVWERGSGETQACGTGACAAAYASILTGRTIAPVTVKLLGGDLTIDLDKSGHIIMTGPATEVFSGVYTRLPRLNVPLNDNYN